MRKQLIIAHRQELATRPVTVQDFQYALSLMGVKSTVKKPDVKDLLGVPKFIG